MLILDMTSPLEKAIEGLFRGVCVWVLVLLQEEVRYLSRRDFILHQAQRTSLIYEGAWYQP